MKQVLAVMIAIAACGDSEHGPHVLMDFDRAQLFDAPVPADDLMTGGVADVAEFPNPDQVPLVEQARALAAQNDGFSTTAAVFFQISEPLDPNTLPDLDASTRADSPVFLIGIDPAAADYGVRYPIEVSFAEATTDFGAPNLLSLLPLQGVPLRPHARYAAIVTTAVRSANHVALTRAPASSIDRFRDAASAAKIPANRIAGITAFSTGDPSAAMRRARDAALARPLPVIDAPFAQTDVFGDFCVYHTTIEMPDWQSGDPPFDKAGGTWQFDDAGAPIFQRSERANLVVTIPRRPAGPAGYPLVVFSRTGGGGDRPLVDRGQQAGNGQPALVAGEGPARYLARAGFAGIEVDGPLGGLRNTTAQDEQFLTFNVTNLGAMRDNVRESALELVVIAHVGVALSIDAAACPGATATATFDGDHVAIMGHSMGAWIAPLAAAVDPMFRAMILSGAGGSWIANIMYKKHPIDVYPVISAFLHEIDLRAGEPVMTLSQWALEPADPQVYGRSIVGEPPGAPRHVLMIQGIVDDYILPRIANATSLSFGLDLAGPELDTTADPRLAEHLPVGPLLAYVGRTALALPVAGNIAGTTAVVTQHAEDGIENGHEVMFQTDVPKHQYQCFLASWLATGIPSVPTDGTRDAPCP